MGKGFRLAGFALVTLAASVGALAVGAPAGAVQTSTWGIVAAPSGHSYRSSIDHAANGSTVHDAVVAFNRTGKPITIHLYVLSATYANGAYQFGRPSGGLAGSTSLGESQVTLAAHQQVQVPVTIHMPRGVKTITLAGIGAEASAINDGALTIQQQLVVLIKATPTTHLLPIVGKHLGLWAAVALALVVAVVVLAERMRRRSKPQRLPSGAGSALAGV